jgi:hypothetical protein
LNQQHVSQNTAEDDWYYLPSFPNYAPSGLPDFDQKQDRNWTGRLGWTFCAPTALADVLWWFDSRHEDPKGKPGDGIDSYSLVRDYLASGSPDPGPYTDDHNYNNVNDPATQWTRKDTNTELIDELAWYTNTNFCRTRLSSGFGGTHLLSLIWGFKQWIQDAGLQDKYTIEVLTKPSFSVINERLRNNEGILLRLGFYIPQLKALSFFSYHYVAVAGVNSNGSIMVSDPEWDKTNPTKDPTLHNNASIVSHDVYQVNFTSPYPRISSWWIPSYASHRRVYITHAVIISEKE